MKKSIFLFLLSLFFLTGCQDQGYQASILQTPGKLNTFFQEHTGSTDAGVKYFMESGSTKVLFAPGAVVYRDGSDFEIQQRFVNTRQNVPLKGENRRGVHGYKNIRYDELYSGIDLVYSHDESGLKYAYEVAPGVDYRQIRLEHSGKLEINREGAVVISNALGYVEIDAPYTYQIVNGVQREIESMYDLVSDSAYIFSVAEYDPTLPLIIDPTITVNSTADTNTRDTVLTLREAILLANGQLLRADLEPEEQAQVQIGVGAGVEDTIEFNIGGGGVKTINLVGALDHLNDSQPTTIDGFSQPGASPNTNATGALNATLLIELNGAGAPAGSYILGMLSDDNVIRGLVINRAKENAITSGNNADGNIIQGCYIGVDPGGTILRANAANGIFVGGGDDWIIGTDGDGVNDAAERNLIAGSNENGILLGYSTFGALNTIIAGNLIGTNGTSDLGNAIYGISIVSSSNGTRIGTNGNGVSDDIERNIISGNNASGISISGSAGTIIAGNYIGTNSAGTGDMGNSDYGILIFSSANGSRIGTDGNGVSDNLERNIISGNNQSGIGINNSTGTIIAGNYIGTNAAGTTALANTLNGILLDSGANNTRIGTNGSNDANNINERNIISGNLHIGIDIVTNTTGTIIAGNYIGTDVNGNSDLGNAAEGIRILAASHNARIGTNGDSVADGDERNIISGNNDHGVYVENSNNGIFSGNYIGTNAAGTADLGNDGTGIFLNNTDNSLIGTDGDGVSDTLERNVISGNNGTGGDHPGIYIVNGSTNNTIAGNYIGTNAAGTADLGNSFDGILIDQSNSNTIGVNGDGSAGEANEGNVISGNDRVGLLLYIVDSTTIAGNRVGTNALGTVALGNASNGIQIQDGSGNIIGTDDDGTSDTSERNIVSGNGETGVILFDNADSNTIRGNYIGTNAAGTSVLGNNNHGIVVDTGSDSTLIENNLISGNGTAPDWEHGIFISGGSLLSVIQGNKIGTDVTGQSAIPNATNGIVIFNASHDTIIGTDGDGTNDANEGNLISGNTSIGIFTENSTGTVIAGNIVGLNIDGDADLGNGGIGIAIAANTGASSGTRIGTNANGVSDVLERNIISGNGGSGIEMFDTDEASVSIGNVIAGNYIGTDVTGLLPLGNGDGIDIYEYMQDTVVGFDGTGTASVERNVIGGSEWAGIYMWNAVVFSNNTQISSNYIGVGADGTTPLGNFVGIFVDTYVNDIIIGGSTTILGNIIANSTGDGGVVIMNVDYAADTDGNLISHNSIFNNFGLAIDLTADDVNYEGDGPDANDAGDTDDYANEEMNYPVITQVTANGTNISVYGTLDTSSATTATIEVYMTNGYLHSSDYGDLLTFLGTATPSDLIPGTWILTVSNSELNPLISAIAIDADGNTGEPAFTVASSGLGATEPDAIINLNATAGDEQVTLTWTSPANNGSAITDYLVEYGATVGFPGNAQVFSDGVSALTGATVTGLTNDTEYSFRVAAENGIGTGPYSNVDTATPTAGAGPTFSSDAQITVDINDFLSFSIANLAAGDEAAGDQPFGAGAEITDLTSTGTNDYAISGEFGSPVYTRLETTTNSNDGYNVIAYASNAGGRTNTLLRTGGTPGNSADEITDTLSRLPSSQAPNEALVTASDSGIAFRLINASTSAIVREVDEDTQWGDGDAGTALWASFPLGSGSAQVIYDTLTFSESATTAYLNWFVGISASQRSGTYSGQVTFTASVN
jgi:CSLREA domain-containing protein